MPFNRNEVTPAIGKQLAYADTLAGTYTRIFGTQEINLPERELGNDEITNDDSPDFHKDYVPGLYEPGTVSFSYVYGKTQFAAVEALFQLATVAANRSATTGSLNPTKYWKATLADGSVAAFKGWVTKHDLPTEIEGQLIVEGEIQTSGKMSFTAGA
jgi:hypothetical protein